jgi:hypothetical protein
MKIHFKDLASRLTGISLPIFRIVIEAIKLTDNEKRWIFKFIEAIKPLS